MSSLDRRALLRRLSCLPLASLAAYAANKAVPLSITTDEVDEDLAVALPWVKRFGLERVEIRNLWGKYNTSQPTARIQEARGLLDQAGVKLAILDTGFFKVPLPDESKEGAAKLDEQWALLDRAFERAELLGTDLIRVFAFTYGRGETPDDKHFPRIFELVTEAAKRAKARNKRLALENVGGSYVATAAHSARALKAIRHDNFGLTWDPNNSAQSGDPEPFPAGYSMLDPARIWHVHLRDYQRTPDGGAKWCTVGEGEFDHVGQIRAMLKDGYRGTFNLETHHPIDGSKMKGSEASLRALQALVDKV